MTDTKLEPLCATCQLRTELEKVQDEMKGWAKGAATAVKERDQLRQALEKLGEAYEKLMDEAYEKLGEAYDQMNEAKELSEHRREQLEQCANTLQETIGEKVDFRQALEEARKEIAYLKKQYKNEVQHTYKRNQDMLYGGE